MMQLTYFYSNSRESMSPDSSAQHHPLLKFGSIIKEKVVLLHGCCWKVSVFLL